MLSIMLTLEDVLETGDVLEAAAGQPLPIEDYENLHYLLGRRFRNKRKEGTPVAGGAANAAPPPSSIVGVGGGTVDSGGGVTGAGGGGTSIGASVGASVTASVGASIGGGGGSTGGAENDNPDDKDTDAAQSNMEVSQQARTETISK